jgi:hypothetical protein
MRVFPDVTRTEKSARRRVRVAHMSAPRRLVHLSPGRAVSGRLPEPCPYRGASEPQPGDGQPRVRDPSRPMTADMTRPDRSSRLGTVPDAVV